MRQSVGQCAAITALHTQLWPRPSRFLATHKETPHPSASATVQPIRTRRFGSASGVDDALTGWPQLIGKGQRLRLPASKIYGIENIIEIDWPCQFTLFLIGAHL